MRVSPARRGCGGRVRLASSGGGGPAVGCDGAGGAGAGSPWARWCADALTRSARRPGLRGPARLRGRPRRRRPPPRSTARAPRTAIARRARRKRRGWDAGARTKGAAGAGGGRGTIVCDGHVTRLCERAGQVADQRQFRSDIAVPVSLPRCDAPVDSRRWRSRHNRNAGSRGLTVDVTGGRFGVQGTAAS